MQELAMHLFGLRSALSPLLTNQTTNWIACSSIHLDDGCSYNDALRHSERNRAFNISELKRLAAKAIGQKSDEISTFMKLGEGGFNRSFLISMKDGFRFVARIPYPVTQPRYLAVASEVATIDFLRSKGIPVPKVYAYSPSSENSAGTEYIFMDLMQGTNVGDIWFDLPGDARTTIIDELVQLEAKLFSLKFPASGSIYYANDLIARGLDHTLLTDTSPICIGPETTLNLWYGRRAEIITNRGPYKDVTTALSSGAIKEALYLEKFGKPLHPFQRLRRESYDYQKQSPLPYLKILQQYLTIAPHLVPSDESLLLPTIRHPDLQPNNIFISDDLEITGLIDWQHCAVLPLFLQCAIPNSLQNYGDDVSESGQTPQLPQDMASLSEDEQNEQHELFFRRQLHHHYVTATAKHNKPHYHALTQDFSALTRRLYTHASEPWEGDNVTLKADLISATQHWPQLTSSPSSSSLSTINHETSPCPIHFSPTEIQECMDLHAAQTEADQHVQACLGSIGAGPEGWVPAADYEDTMQRAARLKARALAAMQTDEGRALLAAHWMFDDCDEGEYM